ncbi:MAG TPA: PAS domain-containing sensor histidine kinase, partial [Rhizobiales bacterium]|nr:PAS domain-containing sensor histidine kinase [Hyphomicrobiales bacterium]
ETQKRLRAAINVMSGGVIIYDREGQVIAANKNMKSFYPELDGLLVPGTPILELVKMLYPNAGPEDQAARAENILKASVDEIRILPNGKIVKISRSRTDTDDLIVVNTDITDYVEKEKRLKQQADELQSALEKEMELNALQRQFVSMASHEFRTPLAIIDSAAQRLERRKARLDEAEVSKRVCKIRRSVRRMTDLMESTLSAARMDAGKIQISIDECRIGDLIEKACQRQQEIAVNHCIRWKLRDLPETIRCDGAKIEQVMANLLSNAVKYSPDSPDIHVEGQVEGKDIRIDVHDHGLGIDVEDQPRLFERFFRARTSTGIAGTGIGLNLAQLLVRAHGGRISLRSRKGEGSVFTVRLPIAGPEGEEQEER